MTNPIQKSDDEQMSIRRVDATIINSLKLSHEEIVRQIAMQISPAHVESDPPQTTAGQLPGDMVRTTAWSCPGAWIALDDEDLYIEVSRLISGSTDNDPDVENEQFETIMHGVDAQLWDIVNDISDEQRQSIDNIAQWMGRKNFLDSTVEEIWEQANAYADDQYPGNKEKRDFIAREIANSVAQILIGYVETLIVTPDDE